LNNKEKQKQNNQ